MSGFEGRGLSCFRGGRLVFEGLDFALEAGGALLITGPNGSGKSSLLRLMAGLLQPSAGAFRWQGRPVADETEAYRAQLRYLGHLNATKPVLTVAENLRLDAGQAPLGAEAMAAALDQFDLAHLAELPARLLSSGQQRRLALARLVAAPAALWLLDEPTVGLDRESQGRLSQAVARHRTSGGMVAVASHTDLDLPEAGRLELVW